jgi:hypothetical protein
MQKFVEKIKELPTENQVQEDIKDAFLELIGDKDIITVMEGFKGVFIPVNSASARIIKDILEILKKSFMEAQLMRKVCVN